jgi:hypothetical protein
VLRQQSHAIATTKLPIYNGWNTMLEYFTRHIRFIYYELKYPALLGIQDKVKEFE